MLIPAAVRLQTRKMARKSVQKSTERTLLKGNGNHKGGQRGTPPGENELKEDRQYGCNDEDQHKITGWVEG